jgi:molecular chaperone GrpE
MSVSHGGERSDRVGAAPDAAADEVSSTDDEFEILEVEGFNETEPMEAPPIDPEPMAPPEEPPADAAELEAALRDKERYHELWLRQQADFANYRKRADRDVERICSGATADLVRLLLPVLDNLERALSTADPGDRENPMRRGVELILKEMLDVLGKQGLRAVASVGSPFDPNQHEAVEVQPADGVAGGTVLEEMQKGYIFQERLIRPALVKVSSGGSLESEGRSTAAAG